MLPDVSDEMVMRLIGEPPEVFFRAIAPDYPDLPALETLFDDLEQEALNSIGRLYVGVPELLDELTQAGYRLALCSNGSRDYVETSLRVTQIRRYFSEIACAGEFVEKTQAVEEMIRATKSAFTVMVGDGSHDAKAAHENNIPFLAAGYGYGGYLALGEAEFVAQQPEEIFAMIEQIRQGTR
jgi:phosphoglycolate phosphatase